MGLWDPLDARVGAAVGLTGPGPLTLGGCFGSGVSVPLALRRGLPLDTFAMPEKVRDAREEAGRIGDRIAAILDGTEVALQERTRTVDVCPTCGGSHVFDGTAHDEGEVNPKSGRVWVRYVCPVQGGPVEVRAEAVARSTVLSYRMEDGGFLHIENPREMLETWEADPSKFVRRMLRCSRDSVLREQEDGTWIAVPMSCDHGMCPRCAHRRAKRRAEKHLPYFTNAQSAGCPLLSLTTTQPADLSPYDDVPTTGKDRAAVPGESLGQAMERHRQSTYNLRNSRRSRPWWTSTVVGYVQGIEATGVQPGVWRLRYNVHTHWLLALTPGALDDAVWARRVRCGCGLVHKVTTWEDEEGGAQMRYWCPKNKGTRTAKRWVQALVGGTWWARFQEEWAQSCPGSSPAAQVAHLVGGTEDDRDDAISEVMKYPFKPAEFTAEQTLEWLATCKGRRLHLSGGCLHPSSRLYRAALLRRAEEGEEAALDKLPPGVLEKLEMGRELSDLAAEAVAGLGEELAPLLPAIMRSQSQVAELEAEGETKTLLVKTGDELDIWQPVSVRLLVDVANRNGGWVTIVQGELTDDWLDLLDRAEDHRAAEVLERLEHPPPDGEPPEL